MSVFDLSALLRPLQSAKDRAASVRQQIDELKSRRAAIYNAPAARADVKAMVGKWVDGKGAGFAGSFANSIGEFCRRPHLMRGEIYVNQVLGIASVAGAAAQRTRFAADADTASGQIDRVLCALMGPTIKEALFAAIDAADWGTEGLPLSEREGATAQLDQQIQELQSELDALLQKAADAGVTL